MKTQEIPASIHPVPFHPTLAFKYAITSEENYRIQNKSGETELKAKLVLFDTCVDGNMVFKNLTMQGRSTGLFVRVETVQKQYLPVFSLEIYRYLLVENV